MNPTIRLARPADAAALAELAARTFREAFGADNRPEDLALHLASAYGPVQQARRIMTRSLAGVGAALENHPRAEGGAALLPRAAASRGRCGSAFSSSRA